MYVTKHSDEYEYTKEEGDTRQVAMDSREGSERETLLLQGQSLSADGRSFLTMESGESLYFVSDGGEDIRGDDMNWNIKINYERLNYFGGINRRLQFKVYEYDSYTIPSSPPIVYRRENWNRMIDNGYFVPNVLSIDGFEVLLAKAENNEYISARVAEPLRDNHGNEIREEDISLEEALFAYYTFDVGRNTYYYNKRAEESALTLDSKMGRSLGRTWTRIGNRILALVDACTTEELEAVLGFRWPSEGTLSSPRYTGTEYYVEEKGEKKGYQWDIQGIGYFREDLLHLDSYEGRDLLYNTGTKEVSYGGEVIGTGSMFDVNMQGEKIDEYIRGADHKKVEVVRDPGRGAERYILGYELYDGQTYQEFLSVEQLANIQAELQEDRYSFGAWNSITESDYQKLLAFATESEQGTFIESLYTKNEEDNRYYRNESISAPDAVALAVLLEAYAWKEFMTEEFPYYQASGDGYTIKTLNPAEINALQEKSRLLGLSGYGQVQRSIRYFADGEYEVTGDRITIPRIIDDEFVMTPIDITEELIWNSKTDYRSLDMVSDSGGFISREVTDAQEETYEVKVRAETVEMLTGGYKQWYYGIWFGRQGAVPFRETKLYSARERYRGKTEGEIKNDYNEQQITNKSGEPPVFVLARTAEELEQESGPPVWTIEVEAETKVLAADPTKLAEGNAALVGPVSLIAGTYHAPLILEDLIHGSRFGGEAYYNLPGIRESRGGGSAIGSIRKSSTNGVDITMGGSIFVESVSHTDNTSDSDMTQSIQDINGDGYADIVQVRNGFLAVTPGGVGGFKGEYPIANASTLSHTYTDLEGWGGGISAGGTIIPDIGGSSKPRGISMVGNGGGSLSNSSGTSTQTKGLVEINGDGLPD
jgi:hypothetical protein